MQAETGLQLRIGIHCGEAEVRGPNIAGIAVHIAARVQAKAEPGQTLVTSTVREAMTGAGVTFTPTGAHVLKGVPEEWCLFALA
jgi:class 3 adenylate cyclase